MPKKPSAEERTVDMFAAPKPVTETFLEDQEPSGPRVGETIEVAAERWRANSFYTAEYFGKSWLNDLTEGASKFRLTEGGNLMFLDRFQMDKSGKVAAHWTGVMFRKDDLYELTSVFVAASRARQASGG